MTRHLARSNIRFRWHIVLLRSYPSRPRVEVTKWVGDPLGVLCLEMIVRLRRHLASILCLWAAAAAATAARSAAHLSFAFCSLLLKMLLTLLLIPEPRSSSTSTQRRRLVGVFGRFAQKCEFDGCGFHLPWVLAALLISCSLRAAKLAHPSSRASI
ncbi:hypothetical protein C8Q72DRAFT_494067 [Fomitopsis betulina]|nr:hypothetical protein C8Q72DRAFT_494067 [Fomitopsis betulina]